MGGNLEVESQMGVGNSFFFTIPFPVPDQVSTDPPEDFPGQNRWDRFLPGQASPDVASVRSRRQRAA
jgi:hypothetical protein